MRSIPGYDAAFKRILTRAGSVILRTIAGADSVEWLNVELHRRGTLRVDLLGRMPDGRLVHIELQSRNDGRIWIRMGTYGFLVAAQYGQYPLQIVLYVGKGRMRMRNQVGTPGFPFQFELVDIRNFDAEVLLASPHPGDNVVAVLTQGGANARTVRRVLAKIAVARENDRKEALQELATVAGLRSLGPILWREVRRMPITESMMDHDLFGPAIRKGYAKGLKEGIERGREKGMEQGIEKGQLTLLLKQAQRRFGAIPPRMRHRIAALDPAELQSAGLRLLDATRIEDLFPR